MVRVLSLTLVALVLAGCQQATFGTLEPRQAAQMVLPLQVAASVVPLGNKLSPSSTEEASASASRSVTPQNLVDDQGVFPFPLDTNQRSLTPSQVFATSSVAGDRRRFPATGYYRDAPSVQTNNLSYFYLTKLPGGLYKVELYRFPLIDFTVSQVVETYFVSDANADSQQAGVWAWTPQSAAGALNQLESTVTTFVDGTSESGSTLLASSSGASPVFYGEINPGLNVPGSAYADPTVAAGYASYLFPEAFNDAALSSFGTAFDSSPLAPPSGALAGSSWGTTWSSKTLSDAAGRKRLSYYTELGTTAKPYQQAHGLTLTTNEGLGSSSYQRTVTRTALDFEQKTQWTRSLTVLGSKWNGGGASNSNFWKLVAVKTNVGQTANGLTTVEQSTQTWYTNALTGMNQTPGESVGLVLTQESVGSFNFSGTMEWLWNGTGNRYTVQAQRGVLTYQWSGSAQGATSRSASVPSFLSSAVEIPLVAYGSRLTIPVNGGVFRGTFDGTTFEGTLVYGGSSTAVRVSGDTVTAGGTTFSTSQLLN